ncbi:MAG: hypothetical protein AAF480_06815 [Actinomycetota bacterium]
MNTSPSIDDLLAGVIQALGDQVLPALTDAKAQATAAMSQSLLQTVRQLLPVYDRCLVEEHNDMIQVLQDASAALAGIDAEAAQRIAATAASEGARDEIPTPPDRDAVIAGHRALTTALGDVVRDLDELQRAGIDQADDALDIVRTHLGPRYLRDAATVTVGGGMIGRG